jgi:hypothetical protein
MSKTYYYKIYKDDFCYIGSTTNLKNRLKSHKCDCANETRKGYNRKLYKTIRENGGWECFTFELIKHFDNLTKQEAQVIERVYIEEFGNMNMIKSYRTKQDKSITDKNYYLNNQDKIKERQQQYHHNNREKKAELDKQYRLNNQDKIKERYDKWNVLIKCDCGSQVYKKDLSAHRKTKKHLKSKKHQDYLLITVE